MARLMSNEKNLEGTFMKENFNDETKKYECKCDFVEDIDANLEKEYEEILEEYERNIKEYEELQERYEKIITKMLPPIEKNPFMYEWDVAESIADKLGVNFDLNLIKIINLKLYGKETKDDDKDIKIIKEEFLKIVEIINKNFEIFFRNFSKDLGVKEKINAIGLDCEEINTIWDEGNGTNE